MSSKEEIENIYNKIKSKDEIKNQDELKFKICRIYNVMNNFEDKLCDEMQEDVAQVKEYIDYLKAREQKLIEYIEKKMSEYDETIIELVLQNVLAVAKGEKE